MMMDRRTTGVRWLLAVVLLSCTGILWADGGEGGIVYGDDHAFLIQAPEGWVLDNTSGAAIGLHAVFYPEGSSWKSAIAVMYVNTVAKHPPHDTAQKFIDYDETKFRDTSPHLKIKVADSIRTKSGKEALVREFTGDQWSNFERIAYVEDETILVIIVLSSRNQRDYRQSIGAFKQLVQSYRFLTRQVHIER